VGLPGEVNEMKPFLKWYVNEVKGVLIFIYTLPLYVLSISLLSLINIELAKWLVYYLPGVSIYCILSISLILLFPFVIIVRRRIKERGKN
jgi:hypothetical protein